MLLQNITIEISRIDHRVSAMAELVDSVSPVIQNAFSSQLIISGAGLIEKSVTYLLSEYGRRHGNPMLSRYVQKSVERNNSLNCEKICNLFNHFDSGWWPELYGVTTEEERLAVDSLKTLRDKIAHGGPCGAGFSVARGYYATSKRFIEKMCTVILE